MPWWNPFRKTGTQDVREPNSPGGSVSATFAICDTMEHVKPAVATLRTSQCSGSAALLIALGARGQRFAMTGSHFTLMPSIGGANTKPEAEPIIDMSAEEAVRYGLVDQLMDRRA